MEVLEKSWIFAIERVLTLDIDVSLPLVELIKRGLIVNGSLWLSGGYEEFWQDIITSDVSSGLH